MKRFSETDKWKDEWFSSLAPVEKLVFLFLIDSCDNAGFFELNTRLNSYLIGISEVEYLGAIKGLNRGLLGAKNEKVYWIKKFLFHQKNLPLNPENNAHKQIISIIQEKMVLFNELSMFVKLGANEGLFSPIGKGKGKVVVDKGVQGETETDEETFKKAIVKFGGTKRGAATELEDLKKKHKDWKEALQLIGPAIEKQIEAREQKKAAGVFVPEWKNLKTWLSQRCWEEVIEAQPVRAELPKYELPDMTGGYGK